MRALTQLLMLSPEPSRLPPRHTSPGPTPRSSVSRGVNVVWGNVLTYGRKLYGERVMPSAKSSDVYMSPLHYTPGCHIRGDTHPFPSYGGLTAGIPPSRGLSRWSHILLPQSGWVCRLRGRQFWGSQQGACDSLWPTINLLPPKQAKLAVRGADNKFRGQGRAMQAAARGSQPR